MRQLVERRCACQLDSAIFRTLKVFQNTYDSILLGGLSGRLDQTIHTLSYVHKMRKSGRKVFAVTDESVGWVLDEV